MQGRLRKNIGELLMDMEDAPQEVLENAPRGHFPAYITPNEAEILRSQGGGVSPGGGQYMVGGIPAFFSPDDPNGGDDGGVGGDGIGDDTGIGPDVGPSIGGDIGSPESGVIGTVDVTSQEAAPGSDVDFDITEDTSEDVDLTDPDNTDAVISLLFQAGIVDHIAGDLSTVYGGSTTSTDDDDDEATTDTLEEEDDEEEDNQTGTVNVTGTSFGGLGALSEEEPEDEEDDEEEDDPSPTSFIDLPADPNIPGLLDFGLNIGFTSFDAPEDDDEGGVVTAFGDTVTDDTATTDDESEDADPAAVEQGIISRGGFPGAENTITEVALALGSEAIGLTEEEAVELHYNRGKANKAKGMNNDALQNQNGQSLYGLNVLGLISLDTATSIAQQDIDEGGLGFFSPGGFAAAGYSQNPVTDFGQIMSLNQIDPQTQDYALNVIAPQFGTPAFNMSITSSNTMADLNPGLAGIMSTIAGSFPGGQAIQAAQAISGRGSGGILGLVAKGVGQSLGQLDPALGKGFANIGSTVSNLAQDVNQQIGQGIGVVTGAADDALSGIFGGLPGADASPQDVGFSGPQDIGGPSTRPTPPTPALPDPTTTTTQNKDLTTDPNVLAALTLLPGVSQNLPGETEPVEPLAPLPAVNLPPVFTEQDARALLRSSGQLPLAGIV
tara:strand:+ start:2176 stop:4170 length:1995 start_codon:yes stop_codon:yes gene_type:complete